MAYSEENVTLIRKVIEVVSASARSLSTEQIREIEAHFRLLLNSGVGGGGGLTNTDDLPEGTTNLYFLQSRVSNNGSVAANTAARHGAVTLDSGQVTQDALGLSGQQLVIRAATAMINGVMTPTQFTKLMGIEDGATADQTAAEIRDALQTLTGTDRLDASAIRNLPNPANAGSARAPVLQVGVNTPPGSPSDGDRYVIGSAPTGAWAGQANNIVEWDGSAWDFTTSVDGYWLWSQNGTPADTDGSHFQFNGTMWLDIGGQIDLTTRSVTELNDVSNAGSGSIITSTERTKLAGIAAGAEVNVQADWNESDTNSDAYIRNKPTIPSPGGGGYQRLVFTFTGTNNPYKEAKNSGHTLQCVIPFENLDEWEITDVSIWAAKEGGGGARGFFARIAQGGTTNWYFQNGGGTTLTDEVPMEIPMPTTNVPLPTTGEREFWLEVATTGGDSAIHALQFTLQPR